MVIVAGLGFSEGNPNVVLYPYDEDGNQCGRVNVSNLTNYPYIYFYNVTANVQNYNFTGIAQGVCVSSCPSTFNGTYTTLNCYPTKLNPNCAVQQYSFYVSTTCK